MGIFETIRGAVMKLLNIKDAKALGCDMSPYMDEAIRIWESLFYLTDQPPHSLKTAQTLTSYVATLATSELTLDAGVGARGEFIKEQTERNLVPNLVDAVQLAGAGGMAAIKPYVRGENIYIEIIPRNRIFPRVWGPNHRIEAGYLTDYDKDKEKRPVVRVENFEVLPEGLHITNKAYRLKEGNLMGGEAALNSVERWAGLQPDFIIQGVDRPHIGIIRMPFANTVDGSAYPVSLYANAIDSIVQLDKTYYDFFWERDTGKRRMILDRSVAMKDPVNGKPAIPFRELSSDYHMTLDMPEDKDPWSDYTPQMRFEDYKLAMETQFRLLELQVGLSQGTFAIDPKTGRVTATQVISEDRITYNTIKAIQDRGMTAGLLDVLYWFDAYASIYGLSPAGAFKPSVTFGDSIFEDTGVEFQRRKALADGKYIRPELLTSWYFGVSEEKAREMLPCEPSPDSILFGKSHAGA